MLTEACFNFLLPISKQISCLIEIELNGDIPPSTSSITHASLLLPALQQHLRSIRQNEMKLNALMSAGCNESARVMRIH